MPEDGTLLQDELPNEAAVWSSRPLSPKGQFLFRFSFSLVQAFAINQRGREVGKIKFSTRKLAYMALLTALSIILTRILSLRIAIGGVEGIRIGFGGLPVIFAGIVFGPLAGGIVGAISDVMGYVINPMGAYMPHFTLTSFLTGFIPGLIVYYLAQEKKTLWILALAIGVGQIISSIILVPIFLQNLFGVPLEATVIPRLIGQAINIPLYAYFIRLLLNYEPFSLIDKVETI